MSKKHYQAVAAAIYRLRQTNPRFTQGKIEDGTPCDAVVKALSDVFKADNPNFSRERFAEACDTGKTRGMKQA